jgi:N utilization substance protein B
MAARSKARKAALDLLFESDLRGSNTAELLATRLDSASTLDTPQLREYTTTLVEGVIAHKRKIDELISTYAQGWDLDRLPIVDRNVMRIGIYELLWNDEVDDAVAIDQALEMVRLLSSDESANYVHGLLARIASIKGDLAL